MDSRTIALRIIHIAAGVFWVGAAFTFFLFIEPSTKALGPNAGAFMEAVNVKRRFPMVIGIANILAVVAGLLLYWQLSNGLEAERVLSPTGLAFGIGGLAAIVATFVGLFMIRPRVERLGALGGRMSAEQRGPTPEEVATIEQTEAELKTAGWVDLIMLTIAVVTMASARYLG